MCSMRTTRVLKRQGAGGANEDWVQPQDDNWKELRQRRSKFFLPPLWVRRQFFRNRLGHELPK